MCTDAAAIDEDDVPFRLIDSGRQGVNDGRGLRIVRTALVSVNWSHSLGKINNELTFQGKHVYLFVAPDRQILRHFSTLRDSFTQSDGNYSAFATGYCHVVFFCAAVAQAL